MHFLYNIFIFFLKIGFRILSIFNDKIKRGLLGREKSLSIVRNKFAPTDKVIWMHAASLGEYEQGLPVLEKLKNKFPNHKILVTFFSPSGYENVIKKNHLADAICYLPFDEPTVISNFSKKFKTEIFFTVKYDYWYNLLTVLKQQGVKIYVISSLFYQKQIFFKPFGKWFVDQLKQNINWFFHQTESSQELANQLGLTNGSVSGDTRFDRVREIRNRNNHVNFIDEFINGQDLIVFGSSWEAEEQIAVKVAKSNNEVKVIIAPHDLKRVGHLQNLFPKSMLYSTFQQSQISNIKAQVLIIDCIGLLSKIYSYASIAVIGGGFHKKGLHNILEAATFGIPVLFGNQYRKNPEADGLVFSKGAKAFSTINEIADFINTLLEKPSNRIEMGENSRNFIQEQPNSSELIIEKIMEDATNKK